jgi:hypothetical protein
MSTAKNLSRRLLIQLTILLLPTAAAYGIPEQPSREQTEQVNGLLEAATNKAEISAWVGVAPKGCINGSEAVEVCEWQLSTSAKGWDPLHDAIDSRKPISLICALPVDGSERLPASCSARPQESNKRMFETENIKTAKGVTTEEVEEVYQRLAQSWIEEARTLGSMSKLVGGLPTGCRSNARGEQVCIWYLDKHFYGNGTVAMSLGARLGSKVELRCIFPTDGRPRGEDSCEASSDK